MLATELDYFLPPELIAQEPAEPRDHARLLRLRRPDGTLDHFRFDELPRLLRPDDLLVLNDTRVLRARLRGHKQPGGARVEALLLREVAANLWEALLRPSTRLRTGATISFTAPDGSLEVPAEAVRRLTDGWLIRFFPESAGVDGGADAAGGADAGGTGIRDIRGLLPRLGEVPLPPYIKHSTSSEAQYQTIYARPAIAGLTAPSLDSAAAPTAGLHFTAGVLLSLQGRGIRTVFVTLAVGAGTFRPIQTATVEEHVMHEESFEVPAATAKAIAQQRQRGGRVVAVGTTTTRVLESASLPDGRVLAGFGATRLFIRPGYPFRCVDALLTNFHLPRSTLLLLVAAFVENTARRKPEAALTGSPSRLTGLPQIRYAYSRAIEAGYRFFSFGDAMLIE